MTPTEYANSVTLAAHYLQLPGEKPLGHISFDNGDLLNICRSLLLAHAQRRTEGTREICSLCDGSEGPDGEWWRDCNNEYCPLRKGTP